MTAFSVPEPPISILLAEDHRVFADVLALRLRAEPEVGAVEVAYSLDAARSALRRFSPDLVFLDLHLAEQSGLDLMPDVGRKPGRPAVVVMSGVGDTRHIVQALEAGVQGWVSKTSDVGILGLAAGEVLRGNMYLPPSTIKPVVDHLLGRPRGRAPQPSFVDGLSPREMEVLRCLISGLTRREIAARLYVSVNTVRTHAQNLLQQANVHSTLSLVALARDLGVTGIDEDGAAETR